MVFGPDARASTFTAAALRPQTELSDEIQFMKEAVIHKTADIPYEHGSDLATNRQHNAASILDESYNAVYAASSCAKTVSTQSISQVDSSFLIVSHV